MSALINLEGQQFGKWTVIGRAPNRRTDTRRGYGYVTWLCRCSCGNIKPVLAHTLHTKRTNGCDKCHKPSPNSGSFKSLPPEKRKSSNRLYRLFVGAKRRAKKAGIEFSVDWSDFMIPEVCPLLGIPIYFSSKSFSPNNPSIDRIDSTKGYVRGNVWIISWRANMIKNNASIEELELLSMNLRSKITEDGSDGAWQHN